MPGIAASASDITAETLELIKQALQSKVLAPAGFQKAGYNVAQALEGLLLEIPSKKLFPVYSPLVNETQRHAAPIGSSAVHWKEIQAINVGKQWPGVPENTRNGFLVTSTADRLASFATLGHDDYVGQEALMRSKGFEDIRATAAINLLYSIKISEELVHLGGNVTNLGAGPATTSGVAAAGGALAAGSYRVRITALVLRGLDKGATGGNGVTSSDGETTPGVISAAVVAALNDKITWLWPAVKGAVAYNVYVDLAASGTFVYQTTVTVPKVVLTAFVAVGNVPNVVDMSGSALEYDGFLTQIERAAGLPAGHFKDMQAASLSSDGTAGIVEFDDILLSMWNNFRLGPDVIYCNANESKNITKLIGSSTPLSLRIQVKDGASDLTGGIYVGSYLNKFSSAFAQGVPRDIPIRIHPFLPQGTILFVTHRLPYPTNQVPAVWEVETLMEYTQFEWPMVQRRYEFGIYHMQVLKGYFSKAQAAIVGVGA